MQENICAWAGEEADYSPGDTESVEAAAPVQTGPSATADAATAAREKYCSLCTAAQCTGKDWNWVHLQQQQQRQPRARLACQTPIRSLGMLPLLHRQATALGECIDNVGTTFEIYCTTPHHTAIVNEINDLRGA